MRRDAASIIQAMKEATSFRYYALSSALLAAVGWGGVIALVTLTVPTVWPRWLFFIFWVLALTGTSLPLSYLFARGGTEAVLADPNVVLRRALWVGILGAALAWLQLGRLVSGWVAIGLAAGFGGIEYFIWMRESARRRPSWMEPAAHAPDNDPP